jgi:hypothetical protein
LVLCSYSVFHGDQQALRDTEVGYFYTVLHGTHSLLAIMWILATTLLMMGGLLREKAVGASLFTLALPVSRTQLMKARIGVGLLQALVLVLVPWIAMFWIATTTGKTHSVSQALFHVVLLVGEGLVFFALALLVSSLVEGEYTAPVVSYGIVLTIMVTLNSGPLRGCSPWLFLIGADYFDRHTSLLIGPIPWLQAAAYLVLAAILVTISVRVIQKREF